MLVTTIESDYVIVGGGSAGCILAERLSRAPDRRVVLIEAGQDTPPQATPANILDIYPSSQSDPAYYWPDLEVDLAKPPVRARRQPRPFWNFGQARVLGGGGSVMGMIALRGVPADYDSWRDNGCAGWGWNDVLPYFQRVERDLDFNGGLHGTEGPIPIRRIPKAQWPGFLQIVGGALAEHGHRFIADLNGAVPCGFGPIPKSCTPEHRVSSAIAYLTHEVRARTNLVIVSESPADEILFEGRRAVGVMISSGQLRVSAHKVILSCGAIHSPAMLMRAGIGPAEQLAALGLDVRVNLPGVGRNLQNHPMLSVAVHLQRSIRQPRAIREMCGLWMRYSSGLPDCPPADSCLNVLGAAAPHPVAAELGAIGTSVYKSFSQGEVRLTQPRWGSPVNVRFNLLQDQRDLTRMVAGFAYCLRLLEHPTVRARHNEVFLPDPALARYFGGTGLKPYLKSLGARTVLRVSPLRRRLLRRTGLDPVKLLADEVALRELVLQMTGVGGHVVGTCRMGAKSDPGAVVDPHCRVHGVSGLRVVDASVMPSIVSGNTNLTVQMIAERVADLIRALD